MEKLEDSLERIRETLARSGTPTSLARAPSTGFGLQRSAGGVLALGAVALGTMVVVTGTVWVLAPAVVCGLAGAALMSRGLRLFPRDPNRAHIGLGATVAADVRIEPGGAIEMGATVGAGTVIKRGATVRMGADVGKNVVIEEDAVVWWGATVESGAHLGAGSVVGAGATVSKNTRVPPGTTLLPGATWMLGSDGGTGNAAPSDDRLRQVDSVCDRLESELRRAPESVRTFVGASAQTVSTLRKTCHGLIRRERALLEEASPQALERLEQERKALEARALGETDEVARQSLEEALRAIEGQKRQRALLAQKANRLNAELTRLLWTVDGMAAQLIRLNAGSDLGPAPNSELTTSASQLHDQIEAIADALEEETRGDFRQKTRG